MQTMPACVHEIPDLTNPSVPVQIKGHYASKKPSFDFDHYLLSSSPPGFSVFHLDHKQSMQFECFTPVYQTQTKFNQHVSTCCSSITSKSSKWKSVRQNTYNPQPMTFSCGDFKKDETFKSKPKRVQKVSFADDVGLSLVDIRYFSETPDMPPVIKTKQMLRSAKVPLFQENVLPSLAAMATVNTSLVPDFSMPIADYTTFSEKVKRDCVSLESLYAVTGSTFIGTVKVKNLGFEKTVFVRCTFDTWKTFVDIPSKYKPNSYPEGYDHFTFSINIPSGFQHSGSSAEFAVCFKCNGKESWDNNGGTNYRLISPEVTRENVKDDTGKAEENVDLNWTTYAHCKDAIPFGHYW